MPDIAEKEGKKGERTKKDRLEFCHEWQKKLDSQYRDLKDKRKKSLQFRDSDPDIVAWEEGRSSVTTTDMQDAIDMAKPDILEQIAGIDEPLKLDPDEAKYVDAVNKLEVLGNVMVKRKNPWFRICSDFLDDSMVLMFGCIKYRWVEEEKSVEKIYEDLDEIQLAALLQKSPDASVSSNEVSKEGHRITKLKHTTTDEYVGYYVVPSERIKFPLDTKNFNETPIVIEEIRLHEHEFREMYGDDAFDKVKEIRNSLEKEKIDTEFNDRFKHLGGVDHFYDTKSGRYKAYEAYFYEKKTPWMMTYVGDEVLQDEENKYGKPPYRGGSPFMIAHSLIGKGYLDLMETIMRERTYLKRQLHDVVSQNNHRRNFVNLEASGMNIADYENNSAMDALIRCTGQVSEQFIRPEPKIPLAAENFTFWELLNAEKDNHTPTPRAYGGLEGAKDERTYRGKQLKVNQASKKLLMMVRSYMEEVWGPLFQDTLDCIAKFMKKKTIVRYLNEDYEIEPEEIICKYALIVNVGLGSHDKQDLIVKLQQLIGLMMQIMQTGMGVISAQNVAYVMQELVKAMGFLNTMDFVTDPKVKELVQAFMHQVLTLLAQLAPIPELEPVLGPVIPQLMQMAQQIMAGMGIKPEKPQGGDNSAGTLEGQDPAAIPEQPMNEGNPATQATGGGFFA
jgi:hypothetical protein